MKYTILIDTYTSDFLLIFKINTHYNMKIMSIYNPLTMNNEQLSQAIAYFRYKSGEPLPKTYKKGDTWIRGYTIDDPQFVMMKEDGYTPTKKPSTYIDMRYDIMSMTPDYRTWTMYNQVTGDAEPLFSIDFSQAHIREVIRDYALCRDFYNASGVDEKIKNLIKNTILPFSIENTKAITYGQLFEQQVEKLRVLNGKLLIA